MMLGYFIGESNQSIIRIEWPLTPNCHTLLLT